ncbi:SRPBCC domain-containing protein [Acinetobacter bereziniae]|uniref:SRPBCC family protein n=1 Tax=Acinetobacter bereziniae TaxID=106648 RepID=UPI00157FF574|nr:SRPBCC domain-containing protein [Acinetobacter bereziniae]NUF64399.1 SRPBCC domain-containing protein [Acinetobacter bereziniae]NUG09490.1 SRPBCC domain-containing protein [Acinetobacter bereziniae]NUG65180.1 SRPBCC domain-containing protein [Acinetobacter bereziniae]NUG69507.1 SRPBCC domain-containing protein [Acinetobacter bereziniae]NUG79709.1 SRPBCC domain-containing protein [Acinetobacter bereziniae]
MITLKYDIKIHATAQKVWNILWDTHTYSQWTQSFCETSQMQSDWKIGGETLFQDANGDGMVATIVELEQFKKVVFKHLGILRNGIADTTSAETQEWNSTFEQYHLDEQDGITTLYAEVETAEEYQEMMDRGFQQGFAVVKSLAEQP